MRKKSMKILSLLLTLALLVGVLPGMTAYAAYAADDGCVTGTRICPNCHSSFIEYIENPLSGG